MLKPYEEKLKLIKNEVEKLGLDVVEAIEVCLKSLNERKIENLKNVEISEKKFLAKSNELDNIIRALKERGATIRQLVRISGLSRRIVEKA